MKRSFSTSISTDEGLRSTTGTPFSCIQIFRDFDRDKNFVYSPCSIQLALSLVANGAIGSTSQVLLKFLEADNHQQLKSRASKLISALTRSNNEGVKLSFVGGVWVDESMKLTQNFNADAETIYKAKAEEVDFKKNAKEMITTVNQWAAECTNGLIDSLLPEGSIDEDTRVVLANALYFKGKWSCPFEKKITRDSKFYLQGGGSLKVPFMSNYSERQYIETFNTLKVLRLPYKGTSLSMYILLPNERDGLGSLVEEVTSNSLSFGEYTSSMKKYVRVGRFRVPKFKINYEFEASDVLKAMGLGLCFSDDAKFNEMVVNGGIKVDKVYHKSHIEVEEEGTEAAASTAVVMRSLGCCAPYRPPPEIPVDFVADHPFIYVVKDDMNGMVLFMGHVVNPSLK
ncbi:hypothetical protein ACHQM5_010985 [Ranunculus cassubicifolius]